MAQAKQGPKVALSQSDDDAQATDLDRERRAALLKMSGYAAAVAPAMLVLMSGKSKALPDCDNPAWQLGLNRAGHSGC